MYYLNGSTIERMQALEVEIHMGLTCPTAAGALFPTTSGATLLIWHQAVNMFVLVRFSKIE